MKTLFTWQRVFSQNTNTTPTRQIVWNQIWYLLLGTQSSTSVFLHATQDQHSASHRPESCRDQPRGHSGAKALMSCTSRTRPAARTNAGALRQSSDPKVTLSQKTWTLLSTHWAAAVWIIQVPTRKQSQALLRLYGQLWFTNSKAEAITALHSEWKLWRFPPWEAFP